MEEFTFSKNSTKHYSANGTKSRKASDMMLTQISEIRSISRKQRQF